MLWTTDDPIKVSRLFRLQNLPGVKGVGCVKLLNARKSKPSETVMVALPPATALLKTTPAGDRVLIVTFHMGVLNDVSAASPVMPSLLLILPDVADLLTTAIGPAAQDGTFVPCTSHAKKGYLPPFLGYTREQEIELEDFTKLELMDLVYHKKMAQYFSMNLLLLADAEYEPDSPAPRRKPKKRRVTPPRARPPSPEAGGRGEVEVPAEVSSPFRSSGRTSKPAASPVGVSKNLADFAAFWSMDD